jgi:virulence-associated protein VapD
MYAILFTLDSFALQAGFDGPDWREAYPKIHFDLTKRGFTRQSEGFYLGGDTVNAVKCVLAVQALTQKYAWFASGVKDIQLLRVEETSDLRAAIDAVKPK